MRLIGLAVALALGLTLAPMVAAQQARKVWRIGVLSPKEGSALLVGLV
jgi:ABC-type sugar transport system substrate-binding protein